MLTSESNYFKCGCICDGLIQYNTIIIIRRNKEYLYKLNLQNVFSKNYILHVICIKQTVYSQSVIVLLMGSLFQIYLRRQ